MEQFINPDNVVALKSDLINLIAGQSLCISAGDFKKLTGDEITEFGSEGRFMMGNLAEGANCTIDTTDGIAIFTKKPVASVWPRSPDRGPVGTSVSDTNMPAKAQLSALIIYPRSQRILLRRNQDGSRGGFFVSYEAARRFVNTESARHQRTGRT
jgi:hypothetical protein